MFAQQERDVGAQLQDGVRAFLIDVFRGVPVAGRVKTDLGGEPPGFMRDVEQALGREGVEAAMRTRERLVGPPDGPPGLYLCHGFCEVGAQPLIPWLRTLRDFLAANPREVVILVIEDYVPPEELAAAFAESGLADLAYRGAPRPPWPTLQQMTDSNQRVVTFLESGKPGVDWMYPAFDSIQETPYRFHQPSQLSCRANRGGATGSLFQINHWIETPPTPRPSNAAVVNAYDFLLRAGGKVRARTSPAAEHHRRRLLPDRRSLQGRAAPEPARRSPLNGGQEPTCSDGAKARKLPPMAADEPSENEEQLRFVANAVPALLAYVDTRRRYVWCNESYRRWFGYSPEEIRGRHMRDVLGASAWERFSPYAERALAGEEVTFEVRVAYKSGPARDVRATYIPHKDSSGQVRGFVVLVQRHQRDPRRRAGAAQERAHARAIRSRRRTWAAGR